MSCSLDHDEIWKIIVVSIRIIEKPALFYEQLSRLKTCRVTAIPAPRPNADRPLDGVNREPKPSPLFLGAKSPML
jgi:hypothetical protein